MKSVPALREVVAQGATCLAADARDAIAEFVLSRRNSDGGFAGRSESSDLYYTMFAAATLDGLGRRRTLLRLPRYLKQFGDGQELDFVHLACLAQLSANVPWHGKMENVLAHIEAYRSRDGGYNHTAPGAQTGNAYAIHLAIEAYAGAHDTPPCPESLGRALGALRASDGGYTNEPGSPLGQTNATAAACIARIRLGLEPEPACGTFLMEMRHSESGGFRGFRRARTPDLLSTASALYALKAMGVSRDGIAPQCRRFVESLWTDEGGFRGSREDRVSDCEYTCYALIALGALL